MPSDATIHRLVFAKFLQRLGRDQAALPEPLCAAAILTLHDATELLLQLASEELNVGDKRTEFMKYFDLIDEAIAPRRLDGRESMRRMNNARIALKHHGTMPAKRELAMFGVAVEEFFRSAVLAVFALPLESVQLSSLVANVQIRAHLEEAHQQAAGAQYVAALESLAVAFARLRSTYKVGGTWNDELRYAEQGLRAISAKHDIDTRDLKHIITAVASIGDEMALLRHGIDTRRLALFRAVTPNISFAESGKVWTSWVGGHDDADADTVHFCYDFVIEAALRMQQMTSLLEDLHLDDLRKFRHQIT